MLEKKLKRLKRLNNKKLFFLTVLFIFMFIFADNSKIVNVRADFNYSNYLTSESISIEYDQALILQESASSSNNYRNRYETEFLFPYRLSDNMFSTSITTNPSNYYFSQIYLDGLDNENSFKSVDNLGMYNSLSFPLNYTDINENSGFYYSTSYNSYDILVPNQDVSTGNIYDYVDLDGVFYEHIDNYPNADDANYVHYGGGYYNWLTVGLNNSINEKEYFSFQVFVRVKSVYNLGYYGISLYDNGSTYYHFDLGSETSPTWNWFNFTFNFITSDLENLNLKIYKYGTSDLSYLDWSECYIIANFTEKEVLEINDDISYNYISEVGGSSGNFPAEYSFDSDSVGSNPSGWTCNEGGGSTNVESEVDGHNKIVNLNDYSSGASVSIYNVFSSQIDGNFEFWLRHNTASTSKKAYVYIRDGGGVARIQLGLSTNTNGKYSYYDSSWHDIASYSINTWYHHRITFNCITDTYDWYIDQVLVKSGASFVGTTTSLVKLEFITASVDTTYQTFIDAIDYSWSSGYSLYRSYYDVGYECNLTSQLSIERSGNSFDNLESLEFHYSIKGNFTNGNIDLYLKNIVLNDYDLLDTNSITDSFQYLNYSFVLNYTYYSTIGNVDFMLSFVGSDYMELFFDKICLVSVFSNYSIVNNGFHSIESKFIRQTSGSVHRGNSSLNLDLYKTNFSFTYTENNLVESDYSFSETVDFSNELLEPIKEIEIQSHIRYGLNTLDINIVNVYYLILINYNYTYEIYEQNRIGNNDGSFFRFKFGYEPNNFIRLNNTGIFGNYSISNLSGLRVLRANVDQVYNRYFTIPYYDEKISLARITSGSFESDKPDEPDLPFGDYWTYTTYRIVESNSIGTSVGNWTIDFQTIKSEQYEAKYPYNTKSISRDDLGRRSTWEFKINDDWKISFVFLRNALADIINLLMLFGQVIIYLGLWSASFIGMYIGTLIIVFLVNVVLYWLLIALCFGLWYLLVGLVYIWYGLVWVYENLFIPFLEWVNTVLLPWLLVKIIEGLAWCITAFIWCITFGQINFDDTYVIVLDTLWIITNEILEMVYVFIDNLFYVLLFFVLYVYNLVILYFSYLYAKSRGMNKKADKFYSTLMFYLTPFTVLYDWIRKITDLSPM